MDGTRLIKRPHGFIALHYILAKIGVMEFWSDAPELNNPILRLALPSCSYALALGANRAGESASARRASPPRSNFAASAPTASLVVTPCPPRPATQKSPSTPGSQPMIKRPSGAKVLKPAQLFMIGKSANCGK